LRQAARVWWGPLTIDPSEVYIEWPWSLELAPWLLERIDWGEEGPVVLLSHPDLDGSAAENTGTEPEVLVMKRPDQLLGFSPLIDVTNLHARTRPARVAEAILVPPNQEFEVELKLIGRSSGSEKVDRIKELRNEIKTLQLLLARLQDQNPGPGNIDDFVPEPLFLYQGRSARGLGEGAMLPDALQRLILEWTDQPGDLGRLRYQCLAPGTLPGEMVSPDEQVHVLTTSGAIENTTAAERVSLRLRNYRPTEGGIVAFDLLTEWAEFGLYLFVPQGQHLRLYPEMTANEFTATKLAGALLPPDADRSRWCVLLTRVEDRIQVCRLRREKFQPLVKTFEWACAIDVAVPNTWREEIDRFAPTVDDYFVKSIEKSFTTAGSRKAVDRLQACREELEKDFAQKSKKLEEEFKTRNVLLEKEHKARLDDLKQRAEEQIKQAEQRHQNLNRVEEQLMALAKEEHTLQELLREAAARRAEIQRSQKRCIKDEAKFWDSLKAIVDQHRQATETEGRVSSLQGILQRVRKSASDLKRK